MAARLARPKSLYCRPRQQVMVAMLQDWTIRDEPGIGPACLIPVSWSLLPDPASSTQDLEEFLELQAELLDDLLTLADIFPGFRSGQLLACPPNGESLLIEQAANLADDQDILTLVIASVATTFYRLELGEDVRLVSIDKKVSPKVTLAPYTLRRSALVKPKRVKELR